MTQTQQFTEPAITRFLFADTRFAPVWLIVRLYVGYEWFLAGWEKLGDPAWTGAQGGAAVKGFLMGALTKTTGPHPDVSSWYATFIHNVALPNSSLLAHLITYGEIAVGAALILGLFTGIAAFFGTFMNLNYLFAGTVSTNPLMAFLGLLLVLAWRVAGWYGVDRYALPMLGTPWQPGRLFRR